MIKNLLFDFGGVIIDADLPRAISEFEKLGLKDVANLLNLYTQNGFFLDLEEGKLSRNEFCQKISDNVGREVSDKEVETAWLSIVEKTPLFKLDFLEDLRIKGYNLFLLSNINPFVMDWARSSAFSEYGKPLNYYFDKMFCSYEMGVTKPTKEIFDKVITEAPLLPEETLFIDDGSRNVEMGRKLGFHVYQPQNREDWRGVISDLLGTLSS